MTPHTPTLEEQRSRVRTLMQTKDDMEAEMEALQSSAYDTVGDLVDREGFPRADIDVVQIRQQRHRLACLRTDHSNLQREIEAEMYTLHELARKENQLSHGHTPSDATSMSTSASADEEMAEEDTAVPFALVDEVSEGSPAAAAGLKVGDLVLQFGPLDAEDIKASGGSLVPLGRLVQSNVGQQLPLVVRRGSASHSLTLTPSTWPGRGLLGCHLVPRT